MIAGESVPDMWEMIEIKTFAGDLVCINLLPVRLDGWNQLQI